LHEEAKKLVLRKKFSKLIMGNLTQTKNLLENFRENETPEKEKVN